MIGAPHLTLLGTFTFRCIQLFSFCSCLVTETAEVGLAAVREISSAVWCGVTAPLGHRESFDYYGLNPTASHSWPADAQAVVLLHGSGGNQAVWLSLAKRLHQEGIGPVYTLNLNEDNGLSRLSAKLEEIRKAVAKDSGATVTVHLVGHSLGSIIAMEYVGREDAHVPGVTIGKVISVAGRLRVNTHWLRPFFSALVERIDAITASLHDVQEHVSLYTIAAGRDWLVPKDAVLVADNSDRQLIVPNASHLSVLFASETESKITEWLQLKPSQNVPVGS